MGEAIGQVLPLAMVVALSPPPIIAVVLMLTSARGKVNGPVYVAGWIVGLVAIGLVVLAIVGSTDPTDDGGEPAGWVNLVKLGLGALLLVLALRQWRARGAESAPPKWMDTIAGFGPAKAAGMGLTLAAANPKNLVLSIAAATSIGQTEASTAAQAVAYGVFVLLGSLGVAVPVVLSFAMGPRSAPMLDDLRRWMTDNNAVIMSVLLLVLGSMLIGDAISGFSD